MHPPTPFSEASDKLKIIDEKINVHVNRRQCKASDTVPADMDKSSGLRAR